METPLIAPSHWPIAASLPRMLMQIYSSKAVPQPRNIIRDAQPLQRSDRQPSDEENSTLSARELLAEIYRHHIDTRCISLSVKGRKVVIEGIVVSTHEKDYISAIIKTITGVQNVKNLLKVI